MKTKQLLDAEKKDAVFQASIEFIGTLTGMKPPPIETAPPETFAPFMAFTERVCEIFAALEADIAKPVDNSEQSAFEDWLTRTNPSGDVESVQRQWAASGDFTELCTTPQEPAAAGWMPIETAPEEGTEAIVSWIEDGVQQYLLEFFEDGVWLCHSHSYEHYCMVASAGMTGPKEMPPYTHWMIRPAAPGGAA